MQNLEVWRLRFSDIYLVEEKDALLVISHVQRSVICQRVRGIDLVVLNLASHRTCKQ